MPPLWIRFLPSCLLITACQASATPHAVDPPRPQFCASYTAEVTSCHCDPSSCLPGTGVGGTPWRPFNCECPAPYLDQQTRCFDSAAACRSFVTSLRTPPSDPTHWFRLESASPCTLHPAP